MPLHELTPIIGGFVLGLALASSGGAIRAGLLCLAVGAMATFASGEFLVSPWFFMADVALASAAMAVTLAVSRRSAILAAFRVVKSPRRTA